MSLGESVYQALQIAERILDKDQRNPDPDMQGWFLPKRCGLTTGAVAKCVARGYLQRKGVYRHMPERSLTFYRLGRKGIIALAQERNSTVEKIDNAEPWRKYLAHSEWTI